MTAILDAIEGGLLAAPACLTVLVSTCAVYGALSSFAIRLSVL